MSKMPRIIVAGQVPPPMGGQNAMVLELLEKLRATTFRLTSEFDYVRTLEQGAQIGTVRECCHAHDVLEVRPVRVQDVVMPVRF